jgi:hypothetical protein
MSDEISVDEAENYVWGPHVAIQDVSEHRWYTKQLVVFEAMDAALWGFYYFDPATELQEDAERFEDDPVPIFPVVAKSATITIYEVADDGQDA